MIFLPSGSMSRNFSFSTMSVSFKNMVKYRMMLSTSCCVRSTCQAAACQWSRWQCCLPALTATLQSCLAGGQATRTINQGVVRVFRKFQLELSEYMKKSNNSIPQSRMGQSLLIALTGALDVFSQRVENLLRHRNCISKVLLAILVNWLLWTVVPVEVGHWLLETQQVVYCWDYFDLVLKKFTNQTLKQ